MLTALKRMQVRLSLHIHSRIAGGNAIPRSTLNRNGYIMKKWILMLCLVSAGTAHAENWQSLGGSDQAELSIDVDSIKESKGIREAWAIWNFKEARPNNESGFPALKSYKDMHQYNCKDQTLKLTKEIIYAENDGKGDSRDHSDALKNMQFVKPKPLSVAEAMVQAVCDYKIADVKK